VFGIAGDDLSFLFLAVMLHVIDRH
jgi:hypothetical protein